MPIASGVTTIVFTATALLNLTTEISQAVGTVSNTIGAIKLLTKKSEEVISTIVEESTKASGYLPKINKVAKDLITGFLNGVVKVVHRPVCAAALKRINKCFVAVKDKVRTSWHGTVQQRTAAIQPEVKAFVEELKKTVPIIVREEAKLVDKKEEPKKRKSFKERFKMKKSFKERLELAKEKFRSKE
jgi:hypothetical protein